MRRRWRRAGQALGAALLCALLPDRGNAFREHEGSYLRAHGNGKLDEAFRKLRHSFENDHPSASSHQDGLLRQTTKSVTLSPLSRGVRPRRRQNLLQLRSTDEAENFIGPVQAVANSTNDILFSVFTDSLFYDTRLAGILATWAKHLPKERFMAVSDKKRAAPPGVDLPGTHVEETRCPPHSHWEGACCKWAEAVILAQERMAKNPALKWAFFSDDDVYLRPDAVASALHAQQAEPDKPTAFGIFGCSTASGCQGLCGGGGFAINRAAVQLLAQKDPATFLNEEMAQCRNCERWADQAISMIWKDKGVEMRQLQGLHGWIMKEDEFKTQLVNGNPNLLFHYERTKNQMETLHEIFTGEKLLSEESGPCVDYEGRHACAASKDAADVPFVVS